MTSRLRAESVDSESASSWVSDDKSDSCMRCNSVFTLIRRKHHCRNCGLLVCADCSSKRAVLPKTKSMDAVRVCSSCHSALTRSNRKGNSGASQSQSQSQSSSAADDANDIDPRLKPPEIPSWTYAFKPFTDRGATVGIGKLLIRVISCSNLPCPPSYILSSSSSSSSSSSASSSSSSSSSSLSSMIGFDSTPSCDPYVAIQLTSKSEREDDAEIENGVNNNNNGSGGNSGGSSGGRVIVTKTAKGTVNPVFNESHVMNVVNATSRLRLTVYGHQQLGRDVALCTGSVPLAQLGHQLRFTKTLTMKMCEAVRKTKEGQRQEKQKMLNKETGEMNEEEDDDAPTITVEMQYIFNRMGEFWSHFSPESNRGVDAEDFDLDTFYGRSMKLLWLVGPSLTNLGSIGSIIGWKVPYLTLFILLVYIYAVLHPWLIFVLFQIALLRWMVWQYVYRVWQRAEEKQRILELLEQEAIDEEIKSNQGFFEKSAEGMLAVGKGALNVGKGALGKVPVLGAVVRDSKSKSKSSSSSSSSDPMSSNDVAHLNSMLRTMANTSLAAAGMTQSLGYYQQMLGVTVTAMMSVYEMLSWKHVATTKAVFLAIVCSTIYSCFFPQRYIFLIVGVYVLTMQTRPVMGLYWLLMGFIRYAARPKPIKVKTKDVLPLSVSSLSRANKFLPGASNVVRSRSRRRVADLDHDVDVDAPDVDDDGNGNVNFDVDAVLLQSVSSSIEKAKAQPDHDVDENEADNE